MNRGGLGALTRYRLLAVAALGVVGVLAGLLLFGNLNRNLVYYLTPQEALTQRAEFGDRRFQLGGLVEEGSVTPTASGVRFVVTSGTGPGAGTVPVDFRGAPAQLFGERIGVVLEGSWRGTEFAADTMKIKHDENYRPPEGEAT
jgi:cytochrome c-type biogenesis protein CcmE